jgi:hypothetical protein
MGRVVNKEKFTGDILKSEVKMYLMIQSLSKIRQIRKMTNQE